jgi:hypothetical protein
VSQLVEIATPTAFDRTPGGKISEGMIQLTQPRRTISKVHLREGLEDGHTNAERKVRNINPNKDRSSPTGPSMARPIIFIDRKQRPHNQLANCHAHSSNNQHLPPSPAIQEQNRWDSGKEVNNPHNTSGQQIHAVPSQSNIRKDSWCVVDDSIDTSELLNDLKETGDGETSIEMAHEEQLLVLLRCENEARCDAWKFCGDDLFVEHDGCFDLEEFELDAVIA